MMASCVYPGTFDPITNGHLDVIIRASKMFEEVVVAIAKSESKKPMFGLEHREKMVKIATKDLKNVKITTFDNLLVDLAKNLQINIIIRGLRAVSDFEYELQLGYANHMLWEDFETIYLMPNLKNSFISSSIVRSICAHNGDVSKLVPKEIIPLLKERDCI
ncbi:pantetheine-phosphate adenylyltransferase [Campylobacter sp. IFREMER_LSEM_CL1846]|uniref:pantetheine-phosphate adenylyltransferase n=2 Tax=unclassified Campylobacter TaxID=2593542 RepID=UPI0021E672E6|nr:MULTISPECIES: pantetheine-phosphate adenylyltransferase [unclassified Campylobacter]EID4796039.1 pantetheine-phosphate adenylyltransferase [Campylobacter lari]MCV3425057.1 pantetheine-phosphate adenylyltransferase [Campylobacter sp. IFREMER_LSEM_CL1085]MCV3434142.1 pantetheine-phosphate adenylyltransferase [Campylobacter sp. IFREMER_LSEM_CL1846]MCV3508522.1 pantetheine-phosphate adenylyltransferase [Campylobacter sp. CNRCH_2016_3089]HEC1747940.1 pantetheine-phosphate adenylyltransferase [Ca